MKAKGTILVLLLLTSTAIAQGQNDTALRQLINTFATAQQDYDPPAMDKILTDDYLEVSPAGELDTREKVLGFYSPDQKPPADKMTAKTEVDDFSIRVFGKTAVVIATLNYTITSNGQTMPPRAMRATYVCRKIKGRWMIASAHFTGIRPVAKPANS